MDEIIVKKNRYFLKITVLLIVATILVSYMFYKSPTTIDASANDFGELKKDTFINYLNFNGTIKATSLRNIFPSVKGVISKIFVDTSDDVKLGEEILVVSSPEIEKIFQSDSMRYVESKAELNKIKYAHEMDLLELELEQKKNKMEFSQKKEEFALYEKLVLTGTVSKIQFNELNTQFQKSKLNLELVNAKYNKLKNKGGEYIKNREEILQQQQKLLSFTEKSIESLTLKSPIQGKVISKKPNLAVGDFVTPGEVLFTIGSITNLEVKIRVPASQISMFSIGSKVKIAFESSEAEGRVKLIASAVVNQFIDVFITLPDKLPELIRADQTVLVKVPVNLSASVFKIQRPKYIDPVIGESKIFVLDVQNSRLLEKEITILSYLNEEDSIVISGTDLINGDKILISHAEIDNIVNNTEIEIRYE